MVGSSLGHYQILEKQGEGGMGTVYRARDTRLDREVAVKVLPPEMASDPERRARFLREAKAVAALQHPNIVTLYSVEEEGETLFLTMEMVTGRTMDAAIPEHGFSARQLLDIAIPLSDAVAYAHSRGITHRDLKPANVMLDDTGRVRVLDFGLAKLLEAPVADDGATLAVDRTSEGKILGTTAYMSPQQAEGKPLDHRTDIFSLGVLLYEMATGTRPFRGDTAISTISAILKDEPVPVTEANRSLPHHLGRIVHRCLAKDPERRYQSAKDLKIDLEGLKEETTDGRARPESAAASRRPGRWLLPAGLVLALIAAFAIWQGTRKSAPPPSPAGSASIADDRTMVVVLPFENLGPPEDAYFADGVTEEITSRLASVPGLGVISRTSAGRYAGSGKSVPEIGKELGVSFVVEGTVRWQKSAEGAGRVRVTPQLIRVADDTHLWSERYDEGVEEIFAVQTRIAEEIVERLGATLGVGGSDVDPPTENFAAYEAYLKARRMLELSSDPPYEEILALLENAVALDPGFAEAWLRLSKTHSLMVHNLQDPSEARLAKALEAADRAVAADPQGIAGHVATGYYYYWGRKDYERALEEFRKTGSAMETDPDVMKAVAYTLRRKGQFEEALALQEKAARLDPRDGFGLLELGNTYQELRRYNDADPAIQAAIAELPEVNFLHWAQGLNRLWATGDPAAFRAAVEESPTQDDPYWPYVSSFVSATEGRYEEALRELEKATVPVLDVPDVFLPRVLSEALCYKILGDTARCREKALEAESFLITEVEAAPADYRKRLSLALSFALGNKKEAAVREARLVSDLMPVSRDAMTGRTVLTGKAKVLALAGDVEGAAEIYRGLLADPHGGVSPNMIRYDTWLKPVLDHPAFKDLLEPTP